MAYRPQFAVAPPPPGCRYESFVYVFDSSNVPALASLDLAAGDEIVHIPLQLEDDAPFLWLGTKIDGSTLGFKFETSWTEPLGDDYVSAVLLAGNLVPTTVEAAVQCPQGSAISLSIKNLS